MHTKAWRDALLAGVTTALVMSGCADAEPQDVRSDKIREAATATQEELGALVAGNNRFALDVYRDVARERGNLIFAPHSISMALSMTLAGARGETAGQLKQVLHTPLSEPALHRAVNTLERAIASRAEVPERPEQRLFQLRSVNQLWGQRGLPLLPDFLDTLAANYGAGVRVVDFRATHEASRQSINDWVMDQTERRIEELLPRGSVTEATRLVLTNAVYFKAAWREQFDAKKTSPGKFRLLDGTDAPVSMMRRRGHMGFAEVDGVMAVELPYRGDEVSFVALLPEADSAATFEASLTSERLAGVLAALASTEVQISLPRFGATTALSLKDTLSRLGMASAFGMDADFSGMTGAKDLVLGDVLHKGFVAVDEAGTEAAAATGMVTAGSAPPREPRVATFDRPFVYLVRHRSTGAILFMGRVEHP